MGRKLYTVPRKGDISEAWAAAALVQVLTEQAKLCGFSDVDGIDISVVVRVVGAVPEESLVRLQDRLHILGVGIMNDVDVKELPTY